MEMIKCIYCKGSCHKNGHDRNNEQRFKCTQKTCGRSFTEITKENLENVSNKRVVLHLLLAGCGISEIVENLGIQKSMIKKWQSLHFTELNQIVPTKPLISIDYLVRIYRGIEKKRISKLFTHRRIGHRR